MEQRATAFREAVRQALIGRAASRAAIAYGLPKEAIRSVLAGHDPKLSRADDVCRALGIQFLLGGPLDEDDPGRSDRASDREAGTDREPVRDPQLSELLSRLVDRWTTISVRERAGLGLAVAAVLDLAGANNGETLGRAIEYLVWRSLPGPGSNPDPQAMP